jgi:hypothetical protein
VKKSERDYAYALKKYMLFKPFGAESVKDIRNKEKIHTSINEKTIYVIVHVCHMQHGSHSTKKHHRHNR